MPVGKPSTQKPDEKPAPKHTATFPPVKTSVPEPEPLLNDKPRGDTGPMSMSSTDGREVDETDLPLRRADAPRESHPAAELPPHGHLFLEDYYRDLYLQFSRDTQVIGDWSAVTSSHQHAFRKLVDRVARNERYPK